MFAEIFKITLISMFRNFCVPIKMTQSSIKRKKHSFVRQAITFAKYKAHTEYLIAKINK